MVLLRISNRACLIYARTKMNTETQVACHECGVLMLPQETIEESDKGPRILLFKCADASCGRKVALIQEPGQGMTQAQENWVIREVARSGAYFPSDGRAPGRFGRG